jgi:hypothetical protein
MQDPELKKMRKYKRGTIWGKRSIRRGEIERRRLWGCEYNQNTLYAGMKIEL